MATVSPGTPPEIVKPTYSPTSIMGATETISLALALPRQSSGNTQGPEAFLVNSLLASLTMLLAAPAATPSSRFTLSPTTAPPRLSFPVEFNGII